MLLRERDINGVNKKYVQNFSSKLEKEEGDTDVFGRLKRWTHTAFFIHITGSIFVLEIKKEKLLK
jgi:hypothetical protein